MILDSTSVPPIWLCARGHCEQCQLEVILPLAWPPQFERPWFNLIGWITGMFGKISAGHGVKPTRQKLLVVALMSALKTQFPAVSVPKVSCGTQTIGGARL